MKYLKARELIEAILNEVLVDDPVTPGQGKAPSLFPKPKPTPKPTRTFPETEEGARQKYPRWDRRNPDFDPRLRPPLLNPGTFPNMPTTANEAILDEGDPNRGDGYMKKYGGTRANKLVSPGMGSYGVINPKTGKPVRTLGKLHKRLAKLSPEDLKRYRNQYGIRTGLGRSGRLYPLSEAAGERFVKIKPSGHGAVVRKIDDETSMFSHRGIVGHVSKAWSRMGGWGYQAGNIRMSGKDVGLSTIHGTHKTMNDAIHNAYMHTMHHIAKTKQ